MPLVLGLDLGTTTITALALDADSGRVRATVTRQTLGKIASPDDRLGGRSEWDAAALLGQALECLRDLSSGIERRDLCGLGVTGQQHGMVLLDERHRPISPFINWQDRRGDEAMPGRARNWVSEARERVGEAAVVRAGCRVSAGYLAVTLFWLAENRLLPRSAKACFLMDALTSMLSGGEPVTDPTCAASSGAFDVERGDWDDSALFALGLSRTLLPRIVRSGQRVGELTTEMSAAIGLPSGLPVFVGVGDNQASFLGSVGDRSASVVVNVGTGGQVAMWSPQFVYDPKLETRPFFDGYLIVAAGLSGGSAYATLERFYREVGRSVLGVESGEVYETMNRLAAAVPSGADGLVCEPYFSGTRHEPWLKASWSGLTLTNLTPGHLARALLEGMARAFAASQGRIAHLCQRVPSVLVGSGNGVRGNPLLADLLADAFSLPLLTPVHREESAYGAALLAAVGAGAIANLDEAGKRIAIRAAREPG